MRTSTVTRIKPHLFYGWWLVLAGFVIIAYGHGVRDFVFGQLAPIAQEEFDSTATQFGLLISLSGLVGAVALLAVGPLTDRFGPRPLMLIGILITGIGFVAMGFAQSLIGLTIINGAFISLGMSAGFLLPVQTAAANWFNRRRSIALAIVSTASVAGGALAIFLEQFIADQFPWRWTFQVLGLLMLITGIPLAIVMRHRPEPYRYLPDGEATTAGNPGAAAEEMVCGVPEVNFTLRQTLGTRPFWILAGAMGLANWLTVANFFRLPLLTERGISAEVVTLGFAITPFMGLVGILVFGFLGDFYPKRYLLGLAVAIQSIAMPISLMGGTVSQIVIFPLIFGLGFGTIPLILAIRADYFGRRSFATITVAATLVTSIVGSPVAFLSSASSGWLYDITGSFIPTLLLSLMVGLLVATLFFYARPPALPQQSPISP